MLGVPVFFVTPPSPRGGNTSVKETGAGEHGGGGNDGGNGMSGHDHDNVEQNDGSDARSGNMH